MYIYICNRYYNSYCIYIYCRVLIIYLILYIPCIIYIPARLNSQAFWEILGLVIGDTLSHKAAAKNCLDLAPGLGSNVASRHTTLITQYVGREINIVDPTQYLVIFDLFLLVFGWQL